jgi:hypothetical protein
MWKSGPGGMDRTQSGNRGLLSRTSHNPIELTNQVDLDGDPRRSCRRSRNVRPGPRTASRFDNSLGSIQHILPEPKLLWKGRRRGPVASLPCGPRDRCELQRRRLGLQSGWRECPLGSMVRLPRPFCSFRMADYGAGPKWRPAPTLSPALARSTTRPKITASMRDLGRSHVRGLGQSSVSRWLIPSRSPTCSFAPH